MGTYCISMVAGITRYILTFADKESEYISVIMQNVPLLQANCRRITRNAVICPSTLASMTFYSNGCRVARHAL